MEIQCCKTVGTLSPEKVRLLDQKPKMVAIIVSALLPVAIGQI